MFNKDIPTNQLDFDQERIKDELWGKDRTMLTKYLDNLQWVLNFLQRHEERKIRKSRGVC